MGLADAEVRFDYEQADRLSPETLYDAQWALQLLRRATERLQQECESLGRPTPFEL